MGSCGCKWPVDQEEQGQFPVTMETSDLFSTNNWLLCIPWESHRLLFGVGGAEKIILFVLACILIKKGGSQSKTHTAQVPSGVWEWAGGFTVNKMHVFQSLQTTPARPSTHVT